MNCFRYKFNMVVLIPLSLIYLLNLFSSSSEGEEKRGTDSPSCLYLFAAS